jgi:hypothetical protein
MLDAADLSAVLSTVALCAEVEARRAEALALKSAM